MRPAVGARCYPEVPACRHHSAHGDRRQHKHSQGHSHQVRYHPSWRGLSLHRWQRVQQEDPKWERRGNNCTCNSRVSQRVRKAPKEKEISLNLNHNHLSFCFHLCVFVCVSRWNRSVLTRFGPNSEFWPDLPRLTNTHSSKVNWLDYFLLVDLNKLNLFWYTAYLYDINTWGCVAFPFLDPVFSVQYVHFWHAALFMCVCVWQALLTVLWQTRGRWWLWQEMGPMMDLH